MSVPSPSVSGTVPIVPAPHAQGALVSEIDRSVRAPVLTLFAAAAVWLGIGALCSVLAAIKAHAPGFLAGPAWLTYGRVRPVAGDALLYGFILQAGLGVALWMFCRLGRNVVRGAHITTGAAIFWNIGLIIGLGSILAGGSTGYEWLEMPQAASPILFCAWVLIGLWALVTLHARNERSMFVSQWLLFTALLWFPWVFSTAQLLLIDAPVRGIMQAVIHRWYTHNLFELGAAPFALAVIFYLLPKLAGRPLYSRALALVGFWLLVFCGAWGGFRPADPFPSWLSSVSLVARVFVLVALLAFGLNWSRTLTGAAATVRSDPLLQFTIFGAASYILAAVLDALGALPDINRLTAFTLFEQGIAQLRIHGFLIMTLMAAVYHITPRLAQAAWPSPRLIRLHFWCAGLGTVLTTLALVIGGLVQGAGIDQPAKDFLAVMRSTVPFLGTSTLGVTLLLVGYGAFLVHLKQLLSINGPCCQFWRWRGNQAQEGEGITG